MTDLKNRRITMTHTYAAPCPEPDHPEHEIRVDLVLKPDDISTVEVAVYIDARLSVDLRSDTETRLHAEGTLSPARVVNELAHLGITLDDVCALLMAMCASIRGGLIDDESPQAGTRH